MEYTYIYILLYPVPGPVPGEVNAITVPDPIRDRAA